MSVKNKASQLAFYDFPVMHWQRIRMTNHIESVFATVRLRTAVQQLWRPKNNAVHGLETVGNSQEIMAETKRLQAAADVVEGVKFKDIERVEPD